VWQHRRDCGVRYECDSGVACCVLDARFVESARVCAHILVTDDTVDNEADWQCELVYPSRQSNA
jgi:hypothetical protein